jgi:hypothetical protein
MRRLDRFLISRYDRVRGNSITACITNYRLPFQDSAQLERVAGFANNSRLNLRRSKQSVRVGDTGKSAQRRVGSSTVEYDVLGDSVADLLRIDGQDSLLDVLEHSAFNERLSPHAGVDSGNAELPAVVEVVEDMGSTEAEQGHTGVDVLPVVVGVSDAQRALVFAAVVVAVTDQACLEMIVEVGVAVQRS